MAKHARLPDSVSSGDDGIPEYDFRGITCPLNFVRTKIELEKLDPGSCLRVTVDTGEPAENVPRSAELEGHEIVERRQLADAVVFTICRAQR